MAIQYRNDADLEFLQFCDKCDLKNFSEILIGKYNDTRWSEELSKDEIFKNCNGDYLKAWKQIAGELQLFGGDTIINTIRGHGVVYKEILCDVCDKMNVKFEELESTIELEKKLLLKVIEISLDKMTDEEREKFAKQAGVNVLNFMPQTILAAIQIAIRQSGFLFYEMTAIIANAVSKAILGRGLALGANAALTRALAVFAGPIGWAITAILTVPLISGSAYRVTIPSCVFVSYMRQKYINKDYI